LLLTKITFSPRVKILTLATAVFLLPTASKYFPESGLIFFFSIFFLETDFFGFLASGFLITFFFLRASLGSEGEEEGEVLFAF